MNQSMYEIYTDGSHKGKYGAWAFVVLQDGKVIHEKAERTKKTCSNRMEYQAVIEALKFIPESSRAMVYSDSRIVVDNISANAKKWKENSWLKEKGQPIPHVELLKELYELEQKRCVTWKWVRAHAGNKYNERCDELCIQIRTKK